MNASIRVWIVLVLVAPSALAVTIDTVPVGNPGNSPDPLWLESDGPLGDVAYEYRIGKYEVTNAQFVEFLNAKAQSDPRHLYDLDMTAETVGGIGRQGVDGSFSYSVKPDMANKPVNFVSQFTAMRFANWMHNGQGNGDTEIGSYNLQAGYPARYDRLPGATWVLPTENEWYKAAYYDPRSEAEGGPPGGDHYWLYPTRSDNAPTPATANSVGDPATRDTTLPTTAALPTGTGRRSEISPPSELRAPTA